MDRGDAIVRLIDVFRQYGYEGTTMSRLSAATGLVKSSLYHHFPVGKEEMALAALDYLRSGLDVNILQPLRAEGAPRDRLHAMNQVVEAFYNHGKRSCLLALLSLGSAKDLFNVQVREVLNLWIDALATVVMETGIDPITARQRAEDAIVQIQGAIILAHGMDDTAPFDRALQRLPEILLAPVPQFI